MGTAKAVGAIAVAAMLVAGCATVYSNGKTRADFEADQPVCLAEMKTQVETGTVARTWAAALPTYRRCMAAHGWPTDPVTGVTQLTAQPSPGWGTLGNAIGNMGGYVTQDPLLASPGGPLCYAVPMAASASGAAVTCR